MTKTERELLKHLAASYYFILGIRADAGRRQDGYYIVKTNGIEENIEWMMEHYPQFKRYFNMARKRAKASVKQKETVETKGEESREAAAKPPKKEG